MTNATLAEADGDVAARGKASGMLHTARNARQYGNENFLSKRKNFEARKIAFRDGSVSARSANRESISAAAAPLRALRASLTLSSHPPLLPVIAVCSLARVALRNRRPRQGPLPHVGAFVALLVICVRARPGAGGLPRAAERGAVAG